MAVTEPEKGHLPGLFGGDLPEKERDAYEEEHDADPPASENKTMANSHKDSVKKDTAVESEKYGKPASSNSSDDGTPAERDLEKGEPETHTSEASSEPHDPNIVDWDSPEDPQNPMNWSAKKKWSNIAILSFLTLLIPLASSMFAPGVPDVMRDFHNTNASLATFVVSVCKSLIITIAIP